MLAGLGAFAGGLADGIKRTQDQQYRMGLMDLERERQKREGERHQAQMDEAAFQKGERDRIQAANQEVADLLTPKQVPVKPAAGLSDVQLSDPRAPGLTASPAPQMPAGDVIAKSMLTGNLLSDPGKLTEIANIYGKHGVLDKMLPWMNQAYQAKKSGLADALPYLISGDGKTAGKLLRGAGMDIQGDLELVDPKNHVWSANIGGQQRQVSARDMALMANPDKYLDFLGSQDKLAIEGRKADAAIRKDESGMRLNNARTGKIGEEVKSIRADRTAGGDERISKLPAPAATAEWLVKNGVYPNYKDAFGAVKTLNDKSPAAQRQELIKARMEGGMVSLSDAAKEVDEFIRKSGAGQETDGGSGKIFKWNPETGSIE